MKKCRVIQNHHISYDPEVIVPIYQGEHWLVTQLDRRKYISKGLIKTIDVWLALNRDRAIDPEILGKERGGVVKRNLMTQ